MFLFDVYNSPTGKVRLGMVSYIHKRYITIKSANILQLLSNTIGLKYMNIFIFIIYLRN